MLPNMPVKIIAATVIERIPPSSSETHKSIGVVIDLAKSVMYCAWSSPKITAIESIVCANGAARRKIGRRDVATTVFGLLADPQKEVELVVDNNVLREPYNGCSEGTTTSHMKFDTRRLADDFIPYIGHEPKFITL